jgi:hypothetical protein
MSVAYEMIWRARTTMPPIQATFARVSDLPCSRNLLWANKPNPMEMGAQQNQHTIPMIDSTIGVLLSGTVGAP